MEESFQPTVKVNMNIIYGLPLIRAANSGKDFKMTNAEEIRDFIHVDEVSKYLVNAIFRKDIKRGEPLVTNVGSGYPIKLKDFAQNEWCKLKAEGKLIFGALKIENIQSKEWLLI